MMTSVRWLADGSVERHLEMQVQRATVLAGRHHKPGGRTDPILRPSGRRLENLKTGLVALP